MFPSTIQSIGPLPSGYVHPSVEVPSNKTTLSNFIFLSYEKIFEKIYKNFYYQVLDKMTFLRRNLFFSRKHGIELKYFVVNFSKQRDKRSIHESYNNSSDTYAAPICLKNNS